MCLLRFPKDPGHVKSARRKLARQSTPPPQHSTRVIFKQPSPQQSASSVPSVLVTTAFGPQSPAATGKSYAPSPSLQNTTRMPSSQWSSQYPSQPMALWDPADCRPVTQLRVPGAEVFEAIGLVDEVRSRLHAKPVSDVEIPKKDTVGSNEELKNLREEMGIIRGEFDKHVRDDQVTSLIGKARKEGFEEGEKKARRRWVEEQERERYRSRDKEEEGFHCWGKDHDVWNDTGYNVFPGRLDYRQRISGHFMGGRGTSFPEAESSSKPGVHFHRHAHFPI